MNHRNGMGLKVLSTQRWYGPGYCGICGDRGKNLIPQSVRFWDPDDGWKIGVLCTDCGIESRERGPEPRDYAYRKSSGLRIDVIASTGDLDDALSANS